jgi:hypothetical protein
MKKYLILQRKSGETVLKESGEFFAKYTTHEWGSDEETTYVPFDWNVVEFKGNEYLFYMEI